MANTQVFTLGVTITPSLGSALDALRRQADGIRLGRLIGEVIRLGLELDKVRLVERALALEQTDQHELQILRLGRELDQVERLRQAYLSLMQLGGVSRHAPALAGADKKAEERKSRSPQEKGARLLAATAGVVVAGRLGYEAHQSLGSNARRRVNRAARKTWKANAGDARDDALEAILTGETGEEKAEGVGSAVGKLGGSMAGAVLATRFKNRRLKKLLPGLGGVLGKVFGGEGAGAFYNWVEYEDEGKPGAGKAKPGAAKQAPGQAAQAGPGQGEQAAKAQADTAADEQSGGMAGMLAGAVELMPGIGRTAVGGAGKLFSASKGLLKRVPGLSALATGAELADIHASNAPPEQKRESYGKALGGFGGGLAGAAAGAATGAAIGSIVPVFGTAIGGLIGGVLGGMGGEFAGGVLGKVLGSGVNEVLKPKPGEVPAPAVTPAAAPSVQAAASSAPSSPPLPATINQQFNFTANMPVTLTNSLSDPSVLQQLEAIARRQLEELMRQARSVQLADTPHIAL
ncbi:hypothetical protein KSS94_20710 [Pseudomonas fakonensis]|uniref:Tail tape measure protein n=1 Tax=Pseudomonas fakonensis TaxID=2842355 RepID=A0ABX8N205_9PSED|nr:hypothetical protein [Pseudomonas fakonensis]QXH50344.1 hypothetical protein KSS94_20710 [Pseudomonas fakonensis]